MIEGVVVGRLNEFSDERGSFAEVVRMSAFPVAQVNVSHSERHVLRGMHYHQLQTDFWAVIEGSAEVHLADLRYDVPPEVIWLNTGMTLLIPSGVAHGFWVPSYFTMLYAVDREYDGSDEYEFTWVDPAAGKWAVPEGVEPILSHRDEVSPFLFERIAKGLYTR